MLKFCIRPLGALALIMLFLPWFSSTAYALTSDDFNSMSLDSSLWSMVDPIGDSSISVDGYTLQINVPAGTSHDVWLSGNMAPRAVQAVANTDFEIEAKFESPLSQQYQLQGILVEQDASNFLRFDFTNNGTDTRIFAAAFSNGSVSVKVNTVVAIGSPMFLRVARVGNQWTQWYSVDGVTWVQAVSFTHTLAVGTAGVFAGNAGSSPPQHTAIVDYFFNTASPISPEDANVPIDNVAPVVSNIQTSVQPTGVLLSWVTDELTTSQANYGETLSYELGSVSSGVSPGFQHEVPVNGLTPNTTYNFQISAQDASGNSGLSQNIVIQTGGSGSETLPLVDVWYGITQDFGVIGTPQKWLNVLGNVSDPDGIASLSYTLDNGPATVLTIGADDYRLANSGDFNIDIDRSTLQQGVNTLKITAVDSLGYSTEQTVTVNYYDGSVWPTSYSIDWASAGSIQNVAQIVDGNWDLLPTGVRTKDVGYDRLIAIGDVSWTDYEITVPLTVYSIDPAGYASPSNGPGVGLLTRWIGHNDINVVPTQPKIGWRPIGALGWYRWRSTTNERLELLGSQGGILQTDTSRQLQFGLPYVMKMRVETGVDQESSYSLKWWEAGQEEPTSWDLTGTGDPTTPQVGSLMLVAHHADVEFGNVSIMPVSSVGAVIGNVAEQVSTVDAVITWTTDELATATIQYGVDTTYGSTISDPVFNTSHSMTINGLLPGQAVHYEITVVDVDGNVTTKGGRSFITHSNTPPVQGSLSDEFSSTLLNGSKWTFVDPIGDSSVTVSGGQLALSVNGGVAHDVWTGVNNTARVTHVLPNEDFFAEVKFDSIPTQQYQIQGLLVEQDSSNFIRFDFYSDGSNLRVFTASFQNGVPTIRVNDVIASGGALYMRVKRVGDQWTQLYSYDGISWQTAVSFTYGLAPNSASLFAGNTGSNAPAYTALIDYYWIDKDILVDTAAPVISNVQVAVSANEAASANVAVSANEAIITWDTDEGASSSLAYGLTTSYEIGSVDNAATVTAHSAILSGLVTDTLYHFQITVTDASGNTSNSADLTFIPVEDLTAPVISNIQEQITTSGAIISWATDELATSSLEYGSDITYGSVVDSGSNLSLAHSLQLTGFLPEQIVYYRITSVDASGNGTVSVGRSFTTLLGDGPIPGTLSDEFNGGALDLAQWAFVDPVGDSTANVTNGQLAISVGGGLSHNVWTSGNDSARVTHAVANQDFFAEVKFDSTPGQKYQLQGMLVEQDANNFMRFDFYSDGNTLKVFAATFQAGQPTTRVNTTITAGGSLYMRVKREGNQWTQQYSYDGSNWQTAVIFAHTLAVASTSLFAGNADTNAPAFTALVDYYRIDKDMPVDTTAPVISNVQVAVSANEAVITWDTNEGASSSLAYGLTTSYEIGSVDNAATVTAHSAILSGLVTDTLYHFQITVTDASGNTSNSADLTFTPVADLTAPVISNIQEQITTLGATISWATDELATSSIEYGTDITYGSVVGSGSLSLAHNLQLTGFSPGQTVYYRITSVDASGNGTVSVGRSFATLLGDGPIPGTLSDEFNGGVLDLAQWAFVDPVGDSTANVTNGQLAISVGGGLSHNVWTSGNDSARVTHAVANQDFFAEVKFDSIPGQRYQLQGMLIEQDSDDFIRFDFYHDGNNLKIFAATFQAGQPTTRVNTTITAGGALYMRVKREGDQWTQQYSYDGSNWQTAVTFAHTLTVTSTSLFAGNSGTNAPAFTALVDYYWIDKDMPVDTTAPVISNVQVAVSANESIITWDTNESASSSLAYGLTTSYEIGSVNNAATVTAHSAILSGLVTDTLYHFQITVTDASGNTSNSTDLTLTPVADLTAPVISNIQEQITISDAAISWATDELATSSIEYGTDITYGSVVGSGSLSLAHNLQLTGFSPGQTVYYRITSVDASGNGTVSVGRSFATLLGDGPIPGTLSDEFNGGVLDLAQWAFVDPVGDSTANVTNGQLAISVGGGLSHDVWSSGNDSARITHAVANQDFFAEVKFDSTPGQKYQLQGMLVEQDANNFMRFDFYHDGNNLKIFAATFQAGQPTTRVNTTITAGGSLYMRVKREGDQWTQQYSYDGSSWQTAVTFAHTLTVTSTSLFAGNSGTNAPAFTALVDYYWTDAQ